MSKYRKKVVDCILCEASLRQSYAYHISYLHRYKNEMTGEPEAEWVDGPICPVCYKRIGYKPNQEKLNKFIENQNFKGGEQ